MSNWYAPLRSLRSLGSQADRPGSLAGLAQARTKHLGQFFTPDALAALVWKIGVDIPSAGLDRLVSVLDNSVGTGRLLQFAQADRHTIAGADIHEPTITALMEAAEAGGIDADFVHAGMQSIAPARFDTSLINPPFSLHLDSPTLEPFSCTTWGSYGPNTGTISHAYALHQALDAATVVVAILPASYAQSTFEAPTPEMEGRLRALITLPRGSFEEEGTMVEVSLLVFGEIGSSAPFRLGLRSLDDPLPDLSLVLEANPRPPRPINPLVEKASRPSINGTVTGDKKVRVVHQGRDVRFKFACAFMEAKVLNHVLVEPVMPLEGHRYPAGIQYTGQGKLDVEIMLLQADPLGCLTVLVNMIKEVGGEPEICAGLTNYLRRRIRQHAREIQPYGHVVKDGLAAQAEGRVLATCRKTRLLNPMTWGSPVVEEGEQVELERQQGGDYLVTKDSQSVVLREDELLRDFILPKANHSPGWAVASPPRADTFLQLARAISHHLHAAGAVAVAGWDYQVEDMIELSMSRHGIAAWRMGCGKGRLAIAMCLAGGRRNGIVVESHLIGELVDQLHQSCVDPALWQVITSAEQCSSLRTINIISYNRLRSIAKPGVSRATYAKLLRRRFSRVVADEAHLLRNTDTAQSRALLQLSPRRRLAMTGTPIANYVQNLLPLAQWAYGDGTAVQPFGRHRPFLEPRLWSSMTGARRGVDAFADRHVVTEWVTREWEDGMQVGAKRQVPKIANVEMLRDWAAPLLKRRHETEPMVSAHFSVPTPDIKVTTLDWDPAHLAHYLTLADEYANWYRDASQDKTKNLNLVALLARIGAVEKASNCPQFVGNSKVTKIRPYSALTSKQRYVISRLQKLTEQGHKTVCYVDSPTAVNLYVRELAKIGIEAVPFHGELSIKKRTADMNTRFRDENGSAPVLVASALTIQNGLNLWQADRGVIASRCWTHTQEEQMMRRLLRPQQTRQVEFEIVNLRGAIDEYQGQMVSMKGDAAGAAIDFLTPTQDCEEFVHLDQILNRFVEGLEARSGFAGNDFRSHLKAA